MISDLLYKLPLQLKRIHIWYWGQYWQRQFWLCVYMDLDHYQSLLYHTALPGGTTGVFSTINQCASSCQREYWQIKVTKILLSNCRHLNEVVYISVSQLWWPETIHCTPLCAASKPIRLKYDVTIFLQDTLHTVKNVGSLLNMHPEGKLYEVAELLQQL